MALSNDRSQGAQGYDIAFLAEYITYLHGVIDGICAKLDADAGVTDTNYQAKVQAELPVAAAFKDTTGSVATISTAVNS